MELKLAKEQEERLTTELSRTLEAFESAKAEMDDKLSHKELEVSKMRESIGREREKTREVWRLNCEQIAQYDTKCVRKDEEILSLRAKIRELRPGEA